MFQGFTHYGIFGGKWDVIWLVSKYDVKVVIPFFMACFDQLNLTTTSSVVVKVDVVRLELEENMFGVGGLQLRNLLKH